MFVRSAYAWTMNISRSHFVSPKTTPVSSCQLPKSDQLMILGEEKPSEEKSKLIRSMIRQAPDCEAVEEIVETLSAYPQEALERVADYGTKLEVYDADTEVPNYMPTLTQRLVVGAYNTAANVLGAMSHNLSPFVLLHEFAHALDASLGDISEETQWTGGHKVACATDQVVRDYAKLNPSEYFAENTSAYLVSSDANYELVSEGLEKGVALNGMNEREYIRTHQNYSKNRLERQDPNGFRLVEEMFETIEELPEVEPKPAMDEAEFAAWLANR